jgi:hypothetical protein
MPQPQPNHSMPTNQIPRRRRGLDARRAAFFSAAALLVVSAACTALVDRSTTQCHTDGDCAHFGGRPICQGGLCVSSGFQPDDCFLGTPQQPSDFLNQCTTVQCMSFDDCSRLGLCDGGGADAALLPPPDAGTAAPAADAGGDGGPALPNCVDPTQGRASVVYLTGSSNFPPLLSKLAPIVVGAGYTPVYLVTNSCRGVSSIMSPTPSARTIADPAPGSGARTAQYFGADGNAVSCLLGGSVTVDVGESDIFASSCTGFTDDDPDVAEYLGPIQAMAFVAPAASQQTTISAEAAREVFGMGGADGGASPWTDPSVYFIRNQNTGTQQMIGRAIGVPADQFWGVDRGSALAIDQGLRIIVDPATANKAIGIISTDYYDADRSNLKALAFKAFGQECAYLPDTPNRTDKQNVRDGHYPIWGPLHFFAAVQDAVPISPAAAAFTNTVLVPDVQQSLLDAFIASSLVPSCAMKVTRTTELGPLSSYASPFQCGCYFDASVSGVAAPASPAGCTRCATANDCTDPARPACNLGFCETQP